LARAEKDETALAQGHSLPLPRGRLYPPTANAPDSGAGLTRRPRDPLSHVCLPPAASFPPSRSALRRPIWAGARGDISLVGPETPQVSKHRHYRSPAWVAAGLGTAAMPRSTVGTPNPNTSNGKSTILRFAPTSTLCSAFLGKKLSPGGAWCGRRRDSPPCG
jgi:hypothetical protein